MSLQEETSNMHDTTLTKMESVVLDDNITPSDDSPTSSDQGKLEETMHFEIKYWNEHELMSIFILVLQTLMRTTLSRPTLGRTCGLVESCTSMLPLLPHCSV